jgi:hypothetical protein
MDPIKGVRRKMSVTTVSGFRCATCGVETVTNDGLVPAVCLDCGAPNPVMAWKNLVKSQTEVEVLQFDPAAPAVKA